MSISIRAGLVGLIAATTLVACGKKPEKAAPAETAQAPAAPAVDEKVVNVYNCVANCKGIQARGVIAPNRRRSKPKTEGN